ncbi:phosphopantetheine-binding protein [Plantactinospora sp. KLBMP9567]|uniref:phosphopantetheine-binding protein n=1 Tax=unclassified Plantactinospora TaxID=2631981 RepID=UPI002981CCA7|nr:phosphopantetheine-binding protein [Plantactinospora sp. KLBMP9567]MDW5324880.1 phosphopantetheine-binding protein [Plantactinospora sp. KLBMP9567]
MTDTRAHRAPGQWPPAFEEVLRAHLPETTTDVPLSATDTLFELGLDSFGTVELLVALESGFDVSFPDEALTAETFATVGSLWAALSELLPPAAPGGPVDGAP